MAADSKTTEVKWYSGEIRHEGFPLHLRFPERPDFDALQKKLPKLLIVTHSLAKVKPSGVPEAEYNYSLAEFDHELVTAFEPSSGITVLVETFGGRRTYYIYVAPDAPIDATKQRFATKYAQHKLDWQLRDDPGWKFIRGYSEEYHFYRKG
ncbi:MAG: DUF695 domain-containing protein [Planctomycetia bacterium]|nr:DUF695 domain-containing protein [Planctomycetia bacterium]